MLCAPVARAWAALILIGVLSGCGYVQVKITASPMPPTPTAPVQWIAPDRRATATVVPSTPLPTATATATPTPILYEIQKGDNLLAIAYRYNVPVEVLIEINPIANPRALQIGQVLVIPPDDAAVLALQPTATSTPMPLRVVNLAFHRTPVGSTWCMGEVENERDESLDQVQVQVSLYDAEGKLIDRESSFVATDVVPGPGRAPFAILIPPSHAARFATYEMHILSAEPIDHWGRRHRSLSVKEVEGQVVDGQYVVQGIVHNQGDVDAEDVRVTLTLYGNADVVVGVRQIEIASLAVGERQEISIALVPSAPVGRVGAVAWGMQAPADSP